MTTSSGGESKRFQAIPAANHAFGQRKHDNARWIQWLGKKTVVHSGGARLLPSRWPRLCGRARLGRASAKIVREGEAPAEPVAKVVREGEAPAEPLQPARQEPRPPNSVAKARQEPRPPTSAYRGELA